MTNRSVAHLQRRLLSGRMLKSVGFPHAKERIRRTALEQEVLAPYRPKSDETFKTEERSPKTAKGLNILSY